MTKEVWSNIFKVSLGVLLLNAVVTAVIAFTPYFDYTIVTGALLGTLGASLSFTFLGYVVSKAVEKDEKNAQHYVQASYTARLVFMAIVIIIGIKLPYFNGYMTALGFLLIRPSVMLTNFISKKKTDGKNDN
ncbi:MAG: ATP synthase subunit I [Clostridia bacterium]|nr:ATP synthase subunit I [Clostridia bacterium]